jgi:hypothetical protein
VNILLLLVAERPDFVALDTLALEITQCFVLVERACRAEVNQELGNGVDADAAHAGRGAEAVSLYQTAEDSGAVLQA